MEKKYNVKDIGAILEPYFLGKDELLVSTF